MLSHNRNENHFMQIAVISDLHLGQGDVTDAFGHQHSIFERFLCHLERDFDRIVLLGDIWETLTSRLPYDPVEGLRRAREAHASIAQRLTCSKYVYVHGNHDLIAARVDQAPSEWLIDVDGLRIVFTHGHHHDWLIRRARWLSEWLVWTGAWSRRLGCQAIYRAGYWLDRWLSQPNDTPVLDSFQTWAFRLAGLRSADVVVTGHTHVPSSVSHSSRLYLNSGSCSEGRVSYLALDTKACNFEICQAK
jgi:predicted phosphodiesterase